MTLINADELQPGDVIVHNGRLVRVTQVDRQHGWAWSVAVDDTGRAIALGQLVDIQRAPASPDDDSGAVSEAG